MESPVEECNATIDRACAEHRGFPEEIRRAYWSATVRMMDAWYRLDENVKREFQSGHRRELSGLLFGIARSAAMGAASRNQPDLLRLGLLALDIEGQKEDYRETLTRLAMLDDGARRLGLDLKEVFSEVSLLMSPENSKLILGWFEHGTRNIEAFGYRAVINEAGELRYKQEY